MPEFVPIIRLSTLNDATNFEIWAEAAGDGNGHSVANAGEMKRETPVRPGCSASPAAAA